MEYRKIDDVTISAEQKLGSGATLSRIFNFEAQQVCVVYERLSPTSSMAVHDFANLPNPEEIRKMHAQLVKMKGKPPELSTMEPFINSKVVPNFNQAKNSPGNTG